MSITTSKNATEPQLITDEPSGFSRERRNVKPTKALTFQLFTDLNGSEGSWKSSITKEKFYLILEKMETVVREFGQTKEEGKGLETDDFDLKHYLRTTWNDCHMRDQAPENIRNKSSKLRQKLFTCRFFELCEYHGKTVSRDTDVDDTRKRESALRYKKFCDAVKSNPLKVECAVEALEEIARAKERLPANALPLILSLENKLLFRDNQIIPLPLSLFGFKILQSSIIGLLLCDPLFMTILENAPPPRKIIRKGFSAAQLYSRCINMWPSYFNSLITTLNTLSGNNIVFPQSQTPSRPLKRKVDSSHSEERADDKKSRIS